MKCEDALVLISAHLDHQNTKEEETALQAHLSSCSACRNVLLAYEEVDGDLASMEEKAPEDLCGNVMAQIKQENRKRKFKPWAGIAVAAALVLVIGVGAVMESYDGIDLAEEESCVEETACETEAVPQTVSVRELSQESCVEVDAETIAQQISDERNADVVLIHELYYEIERFPCETIEGCLLYCLPDGDSLLDLQMTYDCIVFDQEENAYYALLVP